MPASILYYNTCFLFNKPKIITITIKKLFNKIFLCLDKNVTLEDLIAFSDDVKDIIPRNKLEQFEQLWKRDFDKNKSKKAEKKRYILIILISYNFYFKFKNRSKVSFIIFV